jgi:hypothetical protein
MIWLRNILDEIRWKATEVVWAIQDKIELRKLNKLDQPFVGEIIEEIEVKPKKKKAKKKTKNKK